MSAFDDPRTQAQTARVLLRGLEYHDRDVELLGYCPDCEGDAVRQLLETETVDLAAAKQVLERIEKLGESEVGNGCRT